MTVTSGGRGGPDIDGHITCGTHQTVNTLHAHTLLKSIAAHSGHMHHPHSTGA